MGNEVFHGIKNSVSKETNDTEESEPIMKKCRAGIKRAIEDSNPRPSGP